MNGAPPVDEAAAADAARAVVGRRLVVAAARGRSGRAREVGAVLGHLDGQRAVGQAPQALDAGRLGEELGEDGQALLRRRRARRRVAR